MLGFSFLYPAFLIGAAAVAVPIVLHLLKREAAPQVAFSAVRFLKRAPVEQTRRKKLRELLLLALRVAALLLLALAFARPYFVDGAASAAAPVTLVALDTSFSLSAPGQFERARDLARRAVEEAPAGHLVGLLSFSDAAEVVVEPTPNRGLALEAVGRLAPGFGGTRYRGLLTRATDVIGTRSGRIVVVTDLQRVGWEDDEGGGVPERIAVEVADAGVPAGNLAVAGVRREDGRAVATILRSGRTPSTARVTLTVNDQPVAEASAALGEPSSVEVRFDTPLPETGVASVAVEDRQGFAADNVRYAVLDPPRPAPILAFGSTGNADEAFYLERALAVAAEPRRYDLTVVSAESAVTLSGPDLERYGAVFILSTRRFDRKGWETLRGFVRGGGGVFVAMGPEVDAAIVRDMFGGNPVLPVEARGAGAGRVTFAPVDLRHPIFRPFGVFAGNLGQVTFHRTADIAPGSGEGIALFGDGRVALAEYRVGQGRVLVFASDLNNQDNDFPLHPGFLPFVHEAVHYLARDRAEPTEYTVAHVPSGVKPEPGIARHGQGRGRVAVNVDVRESNPQRLESKDFEAGISRLNQAAAGAARATAAQTEEHQGFWRYGLVVMLIALAAEGLLGKRMG